MAPSVAEQNLIVKVGDERLSLTYDTIRRGRKLEKKDEVGHPEGGGGDALRSRLTSAAKTGSEPGLNNKSSEGRLDLR